MTTTLQINGPNFVNTIQPRLPSIANLKTLAFFGSGGDANNANRVASGPALVVESGAPVYSSNFVNLGFQGSSNDVIDTQNVRDATMLAGGVTWAAVVRGSKLAVGAAAQACAFADMRPAGTAIGTCWFVGISGQSRVYLSPANVDRANIQCAISLITNWHFIAMTYSGGGSGTFTLYDFTENPATGVPVSWPTSGITFATGTHTLHFGGLSVETRTVAPIEHAFALDAHSVMDAPSLAQLYAWTKANLARRSIAC